MAARPTAPATDKRRLILDAAVKVFAERGFTQCRVADIADEAGVAYGLLYHYFRSKDEVLDTVFRERWDVMVEVISEAERADGTAREKLSRVAGFIFDSYRFDPQMMKVIIVEVTRAANSFGQTHLPEIRRAYDRMATIVEGGIATGEFTGAVHARFAAMAFYGAIEQVLTQWIFDGDAVSDAELAQAKDFVVRTICDGLSG